MRHHDLVIIGTGSGNSILTPDFDGWDVALIERDVFGGTCLNRGCIPSKMFVYAADIAETARHGPTLGVHTRFESADWPAIRDRVFGRIDPIAAGGERYRVEDSPNVTVYRGSARFIGPRQLVVTGMPGGEPALLSADHVVLAAGARAHIPDIPGLGTVGAHTSDTIMRLERLPSRLLILGGGYIAAEMAHIFGGLGSDVVIVNRSDALLRAEDDEISRCFTDEYRHRFETLLSTQVLAARRADDRIELDISIDGDHTTIEGDTVLVATGRVPNSDELDVAAADIPVDHAGYVLVDKFQRSGAEGVWALGDICNPAQLKHSANHEARAVAHNLAHPDDLMSGRLDPIPHAVFASPQVASVGLTEHAVRAQCTPYRVAVRYYRDTAYGWAMGDTTSFCKLIAHRDTDLLLGAHIIGPHAPTLLQQLVQGIRFGQTATELARGQLWTHPAMPEVVEQALLALHE